MASSDDVKIRLRLDTPHRYQFRAREGESHFDTLRRLADEVGWRTEIDDEAAERLRIANRSAVARRSECTREEFVRWLAADAGVNVTTTLKITADEADTDVRVLTTLKIKPDQL